MSKSMKLESWKSRLDHKRVWILMNYSMHNFSLHVGYEIIKENSEYKSAHVHALLQFAHYSIKFFYFFWE